MFIDAVECLRCGDTMYSRSKHDMRACYCGDVHITAVSEKRSKKTRIKVDVTESQLYDDWNNRVDKYGLITKSIHLRKKSWKMSDL